MEFSGIPRSENVSDEDRFMEFSQIRVNSLQLTGHMKEELMCRQKDPSSIMGPCPWCTILNRDAISLV